MKKIILTIAISCLFSTALMAKEAIKQNDNEHSCRGLMSMASMIMSKRQEGVPLEAMLIATDKVKKDGISKDASDAFRQIIIDAYSQPAYSTSKYQLESINDFSSKYYINCMKGFGLA